MQHLEIVSFQKKTLRGRLCESRTNKGKNNCARENELAHSPLNYVIFTTTINVTMSTTEK